MKSSIFQSDIIQFRGFSRTGEAVLGYPLVSGLRRSKIHYLFQDCFNSQGETCGPGQTVSNGEEPQVRKPRRFEYSHQQKEEKEESRKFMIKATHNMCDT